MVANPPAGSPRVIPAVYYQDPNRALEFLASAFGFETTMSFPGEDGVIMHAEMRLLDGMIMLGPAGSRPGLASPQQLDGANTQSTCVYVDNVDAHFEQAKAAGAEIMSEPQDMFYGDRIYHANDFEGHSWHFAQHIRDVSPEEMAAAASGQGG